MHRLFLIAGSLLIAAGLRAATLDAQLIRASDALEQTDTELVTLQPKLKKLFGFAHYRQLGHQTEPLTIDQRKLLNLGEGFTIYITPKSSTGNTHTVELEWYSCRVALVKTTIKLAENSPVLIKGPGVGKDWIILALTAEPQQPAVFATPSR